MKITTEPRSDQWNAEDFIGGPRDFTIAEVTVGSAEQKYDIHLVGETRVWRPPLTVLRLLVSAWGDDAKAWVGRRVRLFRDLEISFGRDKVGGIRVSHVSHIDKPVTERLTTTRGKRSAFTVDPLPDRPSLDSKIAECGDEAELQRMWNDADDREQQMIRDRVAELRASREDGAA